MGMTRCSTLNLWSKDVRGRVSMSLEISDSRSKIPE